MISLNTSSENITKKLILWRPWVQKDRGRCEASGAAAPRSTVEVAVELLSKVSTGINGSQSAKSRFLLGVGTAMAAEVMGVGVLNGILDLVLHKSRSVAKIHQYIDQTPKNR